MSKHKITEQEYNKVLELVKINKLKRVDRRLQVIVLRYGGFSNEEIADRLGYSGKQSIAELGQQVTAVDIKKAFDEERGKDTGSGYIYMVLKRHKWRMVMPRGKHPKKATEAEIEASKKLKFDNES